MGELMNNKIVNKYGKKMCQYNFIKILTTNI